MTEAEVQQLQALLRKVAGMNLSIDKVLNLQFADCTDGDRAFLQQLQERAQLGVLSENAVDYSAYFAAVEQSKLYKRANPSLALLQVAKANALDLEAFKRAFISRA